MPTVVQRRTLGEILVQHGLLERNQADQLLAEVKGSQRKLQSLLLERDLVSEGALSRALAEQYGLTYDPLKDFRVDFDTFSNIAVDWMHRYTFVPLDDHDGLLTIAVPDPQDLRSLDQLEQLLGQEFRLVLAPKTAIEEALRLSQQNSKVMTRIQDEFRPVLIRENEQGDEVLSVDTASKEESPIVRLVNSTIVSALQKRASDIHIEPTDTSVEIKYRIDGVLYLAMEPLDLRFHGPVVSRIKVMSDLDIAERRVPQDGRFKLRIEQRKVDFRVSILPSAFGESVVIRILAKEELSTGGKGLRLDVLGFKPEHLRRLRRAITASYGMVLVTGPTGSGKTTTLYAALNEVNNKEDKIITIEDPVEYQLKGIIQIPVHEKKGLTFARGLRSILRHDPDKIMVGEIRDAETAQIAIQSALTGHIVFTTVHANNAFDVIGRFSNMGIEPYNFVSSLNCILAQRLVRNICPSCKTPGTLDQTQCEELGLDYERVRERTVYHGRGCVACHGLGYRGRSAITEFLTLTDNIKQLILDRRSTADIRTAAVAEGMTDLREAGIEKVMAGETTIREVNRVTFTG